MIGEATVASADRGERYQRREPSAGDGTGPPTATGPGTKSSASRPLAERGRRRADANRWSSGCAAASGRVGMTGRVFGRLRGEKAGGRLARQRPGRRASGPSAARRSGAWIWVRSPSPLPGAREIAGMRGRRRGGGERGRRAVASVATGLGARSRLPDRRGPVQGRAGVVTAGQARRAGSVPSVRPAAAAAVVAARPPAQLGGDLGDRLGLLPAVEVLVPDVDLAAPRGGRRCGTPAPAGRAGLPGGRRSPGATRPTAAPRGGGAGGTARTPRGSLVARASLTTTASRIVITFSQVLQRILRIFCLTLSSAMEYLVWQRSQTNFIRNFRGLPRGPAYHRVSAEPGCYYNHRVCFLKRQRRFTVGQSERRQLTATRTSPS